MGNVGREYFGGFDLRGSTPYMTSSASIFCDTCGAANVPERAFCTVCGSSLVLDRVSVQQSLAAPAAPIFCDTCGAANVPQSDHCAVCGSSLQTLTHLISSQKQSVSAVTTQHLPTKPLLKGRYNISQQIGKGGFGAVYKAVDTQIGNRIVAVKEMNHDHLSPQESAEASEHFQQEVFLLARLKHPNLPSIYDYFIEAGHWYVVMDFIEGETLEDYLTRTGNGHRSGGPLPIDESLRIGIELCMVLDYLHTRQPPIIFRDLKPANIMRNADGQLYLIDFGIARIFKRDKLKDTVALGSPGYAAPEQYGKAQTTPRSDIYALGALLHQLVTGNDPSLTPFVFQPPQLPGYPQLSTLIMQMLEPDVNRRPPSIAVIRQILQGLSMERPQGLGPQVYPWQGPPVTMGTAQQYQPSVAPAYSPVPVQLGTNQAHQQMYQPNQPASAPPPTKHGMSRRALIVGIVGMIVGGEIISAIVRSQSQAVPPGPSIQVTSVPTPDISGTSALKSDILTSTAIWSVAWSPNGKYVASGDGTGAVYITDATNTNHVIVQTYNGHGNAAVTAVAWSPDSRLVASASYDQTVQVWNARTGKHVFTFNNFDNPVSGVAWSPDGKRLVSGDYNGTIQVLDVHSGKMIDFYDTYLEPITSIAWSPNGRYIAYVVSTNLVQVVQIRASIELLYTYGVHSDVVQSVAWSPDSKRIASASNDHTVQVWDTSSGSIILTYKGHSDQVWSVQWSSDGRRIASGSFDKTVQVWDADNGGNASIFKDGNKVTSVAWSPEGKAVVVGDVNGALKWWNVGA